MKTNENFIGCVIKYDIIFKEKNMKQKYLNFIIIFLLILGLFYFYSFKNKELDIISGFSIISALAMPILTCIYVSTCESQLEVMKKQLSEMELDSKLRELPYFIIKNIIFKIEKPKLFWSGPDNRIEYLSRFFIMFKIDNLSSFPAINVIANVRIKSKHYGELKSCDNALEFIFNNETKSLEYMFPENTTYILNEIRNYNINDIPIIDINIYYQNIFGGCFRYKKEFKVYCPDDKEEILTKILTSISSFETKYLTQLTFLSSERNETKKHRLFDGLVKSIENNEPGLEDTILNVEQNSYDISLEHIEKEEYVKAKNGSFFGRKIRFGYKSIFCK